MKAVPIELHRLVRDRLGDHGQRYTTGRQRLVEALLAAEGPVTLPELLQTPTALPQSSAYRNLLVLEQAGAVRRLLHATGHAHYELAEQFTSHHHHLICENCGTIQDIQLSPRLERTLDRAFDDVTSGAGFTARTHSIDIYGACVACAS